MKKAIMIFVLTALLLVSVAVWALKGKISGNSQEMAMAAGVVLLAGFAAFQGISRLRSRARREADEDELSKTLMTKASSLAFYLSLYMWLMIMIISDRAALPVHTLIGAGLMGMAVIFLLSWLFLKMRGLKND